MSQQLQITGGAKVRSLEGVITGSTGVLGSLPINASNGIPQLDVNGKILVSQLPNSVMEYKGTWNAATNTPTLADGTGNQGDVYLCNVAGTVNFGSGPISFVVGDQVIYSGTIWQKASGATGTVTSVAVTESGDALTITGSPITTSGTINIGFAGSSAQYVAGDGSLINFPTVVTQAQNLVTEVYNNSGATMTKGTVVYINGGQGNLPTIAKAIATGDSTSAQTYGVVRTDITNMNNGYVTVIGNLDNLDTQAYAAGTQLYLSSTTAGAWTSTKQYAPAHLVYVGIVVRSHPTQGVVEIRIQNGFELDELHDVSAQTPTNNQGLFYNSSNSLWENKSIATALGYTPISLTSLSATSPLSYNNTTGVFSISQASGSTSGFLSSTDWTTFNNKQNALTNPITGTGASGQIAYFNGTTTQTSSANLTWDNTNLILSTKSLLATTDVAAYNLTINNEDFGKIQNVTDRSWSLAYSSGGTANALGNSALVWNYLGNVIVINKLSVGNYNTTYNLDITGTARFTGQLTLGSTITNGTNTYTLPSATGTLALSSDLSGYLPLTGGTLTGALIGTSASFSSSVTATQGNFNQSGSAFPLNLKNRNATQTWAQIIDVNAIDDKYFGLYDVTNSLYRLVVTNGGNVGIGTTSPTTVTNYIVQTINGTSGSFTEYQQGGSYAFRIGSDSSLGGFLNQTDANPIRFFINSGERMRITSTGNVGIGTSSPTSPLHVGTATSGNQKIQQWGEPGFVDNYGLILRGSSLDGVFKFYGLNNGTETTNPILSMNRNTSNVGMGTAAPTNYSGYTTLSINNATNGGLIDLQYNGTSAFRISGEATQNAVFGATNIPLVFSTNSIERMRITSGGLVLIGTTSSSGVDKVRINNDGATSYSTVNITNANSTANFYVGVGGGSVANSNLQNNAYVWNAAASSLVFGTSDSARLTISSTGTASFTGGINAGTLYLGSLGTGTVYSSSGTLTNTNPSDKRLKENITPITYGLNEILKLNPVSFDWKNDNNKNKQFGFIAQEVQEVMPEAVIDGEYLGLEKDAIYTALINAIKEQQKQIDELKAKIK